MAATLYRQAKDDVEMNLGIGSGESSEQEEAAVGCRTFFGRRLGRLALPFVLGAAVLLAVGAAAKSRSGGLLTTASAAAFQDKQSLQATSGAQAPPVDQINSVNQLTGGKGAVATQPSSPLAPAEDTNDGNECADDEEDHLGLCYKKCSLLTNGVSPVRVSAFGCAKSKSLGDIFGETIASMIPCKGYDIAGDAEGNGCPHQHGACLTDEEMSLGKCYKKCSLFYEGEYPHRTAASTCCKSTNLIQCLNPANIKISSDLATGGGTPGDGISGDSAVHDPIKSLTEQ
eukprot:TRINITY_DN6177_c0_g1_i1.p1 TRINITY_DN6177_c0_g1~~TRINITY_DN6177_c0_g1_i1.p1  ORF type:complete len:286 (-),score=51.74 TRINITY_DN6177_c0_g1_i1:68-925(-)